MTMFRNKIVQFLLLIFVALLPSNEAMSSILVNTFASNDQYDYLNSTRVNQNEVALFQRFLEIPEPMFFDEITLAASHVSGPNDVFVDIYHGSIQPGTLVASFHLVDELPQFSSAVPSSLPQPTTITVLDDIFFDLQFGPWVELLVLMRPGQNYSDIVWHHSLTPLDAVSLEAIRVSVRPIPAPSSFVLMLTGVLGVFAFCSRRYSAKQNEFIT